MNLSLNLLHIPFLVGDPVWVAQPCGDDTPQPYFQGRIMQIILNSSSLTDTTAIRQRKEIHELLIDSAVYDLKPLGEHDGSPRISVNVPLFSAQKTLFETKQELLDQQEATQFSLLACSIKGHPAQRHTLD
ncbi:MAG: hypothetical protein LH609_21840 [Rudanella sp.]|nr:hypothetical protein [Rudanella sp.]